MTALMLCPLCFGPVARPRPSRCPHCRADLDTLGVLVGQAARGMAVARSPRSDDLARIAAAQATLPDDLRALAARYHLGGLVNAIDDLAKPVGAQGMPPEAIEAAAAVLTLLDALGLHGAGHPLAGDVWREATR